MIERTIKKWEDEVFLRVKSEDKGEFITKEKTVEDNQLRCENGGFEIDTILDTKPSTNVFHYTIESEGLVFWYQADNPEWDQTDDVIGSYAIYHKTKRNNKYKAGKAFHIYRSKIIDKDGDWVWGDFNNDLDKTGILSVTVPQDFLDKAKYPVRIDPTFGDESMGTTSQSSIEEGIRCSRFTMGANAGEATNVSIGVYRSAFDVGGRGVIIINSDKSLTAVGDEVTINNSSPTWFDSPCNGETLDASTLYYLGAWAGNPTPVGAVYMKFDGGGYWYTYDTTVTYHSTNDPVYSLVAPAMAVQYSAHCDYDEVAAAGRRRVIVNLG